MQICDWDKHTILGGKGGQGNALERAVEMEPNLVGSFPESYADF